MAKMLSKSESGSALVQSEGAPAVFQGESSIMKSPLIRLLIVGSLLTLGWLGCAPPPPSETDETTAEAEKTAAPAFTLATPDGTSVSLSDSAGKIRLVDFWATWCAPCRDEIPFLNELQAKYGSQGFEIIAIADADEPADIVSEFMVEHEVKYINLLGSDDVATAYGVFGLPAAYLIDAEGNVVKSFLGPKPEGILKRQIEDLLAARPAT
jgi:thiol-disulfide isomerase/thioredoxin